MAQPEFVNPNLWTLADHTQDLIIKYSTNAPLFGGTHLTYQDGMQSLTFSSNNIRVVDVPDIGELVSVTIAQTVDAGSTTFSLLLPKVNILSQGPISSVNVSTLAIKTMHAGPLAPPFGHGQQDIYSAPLQLTGSASHLLAE